MTTPWVPACALEMIWSLAPSSSTARTRAGSTAGWGGFFVVGRSTAVSGAGFSGGRSLYQRTLTAKNRQERRPITTTIKVQGPRRGLRLRPLGADSCGGRGRWICSYFRLARPSISRYVLYSSIGGLRAPGPSDAAPTRRASSPLRNRPYSVDGRARCSGPHTSSSARGRSEGAGEARIGGSRRRANTRWRRSARCSGWGGQPSIGTLVRKVAANFDWPRPICAKGLRLLLLGRRAPRMGTHLRACARTASTRSWTAGSWLRAT